MKTPLLKMENITVKYDSFPVLNDLYFCAEKGEIHGLIGGNAEGKSTLGHVLAGVVPFYSGNIFIEGKEVRISSRPQSESLGIRMSFHKTELYPDLSILENIVAGRESSFSKGRIFTPKKSKTLPAVKKLMDELCLDLDPFAPAKKLSEGERMLIQLAHTLIGDPKIIVLDEPTAILTRFETDHIFKILHRLRDEGKCIIMVSHSISELLEHSDKISILKDGSLESYTCEEARYLPLLNIMTGQTQKFQYPKLPAATGKAVMQVEHMHAGILKDISFTLHEGEILGVAGLVGSGRTTLINAVSGSLKLNSGNIRFMRGNPSQFSQSFGIVPDNYDITALFSKMNIARNITVSNLRRVLKDLLISSGKEDLYARDMVERLGISPNDVREKLGALSAGNRQKVVIARSVFSNAGIYLFDEPTQNLSAVSKMEIYNIFNALVSKGAAIILISSDFSELLGMCSSIIMLRDGQQVGEADNRDLNAEFLYTKTTG